MKGHNKIESESKIKEIESFLNKQKIREKENDIKKDWLLIYNDLEKEKYESEKALYITINNSLSNVITLEENIDDNEDEIKDKINTIMIELKNKTYKDDNQLCNEIVKFKNDLNDNINRLLEYQNEIDDYLKLNDEKFKNILLSTTIQIKYNYKLRWTLNGDLNDLINKCENEIEVMRERMNNELYEIKDEFVKISQDERSCIIPNDEYHSMFLYLKRYFEKKGFINKELNKKVQSMLNIKISLPSLMQYNHWYEEQRNIMNKYKDVFTMYERKLNNIVETSQTKIESFINERNNKSDVLIKSLYQDIKCEECKRRYNIQKCKEKKKDIEDDKMERKMIRIDEDKKIMIKNYRKMKEEEKEEKKKEIEKIIKQRKIKDKQKSIINEKRVTFRREEYDKKRQRQKVYENEKLKKENLLKKKLERIRSKVKIEVERDENRMKSETESFRNYVNNEDEKNIYQFQEIYGYTTDMLMKDMRVKVQEALMINQLHNNTYAKYVLKNVKPYKNIRRDMLESM